MARTYTIMDGNPAIEFVVYEKPELLEIVEKDSPEDNDQNQAVHPREYTEKLVKARKLTLKDLLETLASQFGGLIAERDVLELGPGILDIFYQAMRRKNPAHWTALDINDEIIKEISKKNRSEKYDARQGTMRKIPFQSESFDVVCGLATLDSIIDFETVGTEITRVLKPGGLLIHIQDLLPSWMTIFHLAATDPVCDTAEVGFYQWVSGKMQGITHIQVPDKAPYASHEYLHHRLEQEFTKYGLKKDQRGLQRFAPYQLICENHYVHANLALKRFDRLEPSYAFLIMRK